MKWRKIGFTVLAIVTTLSLVAWQRIYAGTPFTGVMWLTSITGGLRSNVRDIQWDAAGVNEIRNNWHFEEYDQTADCVGSPEVGDKLRVYSTFTTIPNTGAFAYNDCNGPNPDVNEEVEIAVNSNSVVAGTNYQYDVTWYCNGTNISGEVNVSFEYSSVYHDWNTNTQYWGWCGGAAQLSTPNSQVESESWQSQRLSAPPHVIVYESEEQGNTLHYEVLRISEGKLRARVRIDFSDANAFKNYQQLNSTWLASWRDVASSEPILAVVTLRDPITSSELAAVAEKTGMEIVSFGAFGANDVGQQVSVYVWPINDQDTAIPAEESVKYDGVRTFMALIKPVMLEPLLSDPRVVLVDVSANQVKDEVFAKLGESIDVTQIGVPNPAWLFASGELILP